MITNLECEIIRLEGKLEGLTNKLNAYIRISNDKINHPRLILDNEIMDIQVEIDECETLLNPLKNQLKKIKNKI